MGSYAFAYCTSLETAYWNAVNCSVQYSGGTNQFFAGCVALKLIIGNNVKSISNFMFEGCGMKKVIIGSGVTSIGSYAFYNCSNLTEITVGSNVTSIGDLAFYNCSSLIEITIPARVTAIGMKAFLNCTSLENANFASPSLWKISASSDFSYTRSISNTDLADSATAAKYLKETYIGYYWKRG